jgi:hypothetical protein
MVQFHRRALKFWLASNRRRGRIVEAGRVSKSACANPLAAVGIRRDIKDDVVRMCSKPGANLCSLRPGNLEALRPEVA